MKTNYMNETEVKNEVGKLFAKEKVSFHNWLITDVTIQPTGFDAVVELVSLELRREMNIIISGRCTPIFVTNTRGNKGKMFMSLREALNL